MFGVEYETGSSAFQSVQDQEVPCAVCKVSGRMTSLMIPAKKTCPQGWTREYWGYLAAQYYSHHGSTFECLDFAMETVHESVTGNENGGLFYQVDARCGSLPCPPYGEFNDLLCVVCTV